MWVQVPPAAPKVRMTDLDIARLQYIFAMGFEVFGLFTVIVLARVVVSEVVKDIRSGAYRHAARTTQEQTDLAVQFRQHP